MITTNYLLTLTETDNLLELKYQTKDNEKGIIYKIAGVLYVHGYSVIKASVYTDEDGNISDYFEAVKYGDSAYPVDSLEEDLRSLLDSKMTVMTYITKFPEKYYRFFNDRDKEITANLSVLPGEKAHCAEISLSTSDRPGLIFEITQVLYMMYYDIVSISADTENSNVNDKLIIQREDKGIIEPASLKNLQNSLYKLL